MGIFSRGEYYQIRAYAGVTLQELISGTLSGVNGYIGYVQIISLKGLSTVDPYFEARGSIVAWI